jgi:predicted O-linked N-acetylglucosamine transferase (SPINDLY family)
VDAAARHLERAIELGAGVATWLSLASLVPGCPGADPAHVLAVRRRAAAALGAAQEVAGPSPVGAAPHRQGEPIRVGYLSAYFHAANYMKPVWGLVNHHDRSAFRLHLFSDSPPGAAWQGYRPRPEDRVHDTSALDNGQLAELVRGEGIDVLVDLNAYSVVERLPLFFSRPAPVTVGWFNHYATSGLPGLDYVVGDEEVVRPGEERFFSERVVRLPLSYLTFGVDHAVPPVVPPPCLANGFVTFGSLVSQYKVTPQVLDAWAEILRRAPDARLLLANTALKSAQNRGFLAEQLARRGVDPARLDLCGPADHLEFLRYYDRIDVALDAFPYNGGTTTMEAVWQGVPVLTFDGDRWASRTSQSLLRRTHLAGFVAADVRGMVEAAVGLARGADTPGMLAGLRGEMRSRLMASPACDTAALAREMERFYLSAVRGEA